MLRNLNFKYLAAKNFVCFGPEGVEINLNDYGNIILVHGRNLDVIENGGEDSRNGVGKSSIADILVYTLYGKPLKKGLKHQQVINHKIKKNLRTEVRWDKYRVVRTREPDSLKLWESEDGIWDTHIICPETNEKIIVEKKKDGKVENSKGDVVEYTKDDIIDPEITLGGMTATQKLIEEKIGLNYVTFCNVVVFTDDNAGSFLECDAKTKREIVENLLSLDKYRNFSDKAKEIKNLAKRQIAEIGKEYDHLLIEQTACEKRVAQVEKEEKTWKKQKETELRSLVGKIRAKKSELENCGDLGKALAAYNEAQNEIKDLNEEIPSLEEERIKVEGLVDKAEEKLATSRDQKNKLDSKISALETNIKDLKRKIADYEQGLEDIINNKNAVCDKCLGVVGEENIARYKNESEEQANAWKKDVEISEEKLEKLCKEGRSLGETISKLSEGIKKGKVKAREVSAKITKNREKISKLTRVEKPEAGTTERLLEEQLEELKKQALAKKQEYEGVSPFAEIHKSAIKELEEKTKEVKDKKKEAEEAEAELPYYEFWVKAFGDKGIRKFVIDGIIPALNSRTTYWLQFLIDGKIKLVFNNKLEETIERNPPDGDPFVYAQMSMGEKRRLNLTVSQAFAHVMMLNTGCVPSCVFLDEVTTNIDPIGVVGVYNMIAELSKDRQVFVTTHDQGLLELLRGCDEIHLERKNGFTKLV